MRLNRGENITIIFINNAIYGMTGGQMAPTTLVGMKTSTSPYGRDVHLHGYPLKMADIAAQLEGTAYVTRQSVQYGSRYPQGKESHPQGVRELHGRQGFQPRGNRFYLQLRLEDDSCRSPTNGWRRTCSPSIRWAT